MATTMTNPTVDEPVNAASVRDEDQTQIRGFPRVPVSPHTAPLDTDALPLNLDSLPLHTGSDWIEPDPLAAGQSATVDSLLGNRYLLEYKVGEGGMGVVYRATDVEVKGEIFAIKVLKPAIQQRPDALKLLREEVRKTRGLRHPNIVGVYSLNSDPSGAYMLMEFLEGKSLSSLMDEEFGRGMPLMRAWPLINDIGSALAYAHDHNVIHSDLKPSNLFVTVSGKAMLLDFGIARAVRVRSDRFDTGSLGASTPAYASSEMLTGNAPDQSDDIYSFACVIYEMLSGKHPFNSLSAVDAQRVGMRLAPLSSLTRRQNQALALALAFERAQRTTSVEALLAGLKGAAQRRPQSLIWLGTGAAACIVAAGAAAWMEWRGPAPERARIASPAATPAVPNAERAAVPATPGKDPLPVDTSAEPVRAKTTNQAATSAAKPVRDARDATGATVAALAAVANLGRRVDVPEAKAAATPAVLGQSSSAAPAGAMATPTAEPVSAESTGIAAPAVESDVSASQSGPATHPDIGGVAPIGKNVPAIIPLPDAASKMTSCPYPEDALRQLETGTVVLLVYVSPEGAAANTQVDKSSGSASLDQAAVSCVQEFGQFAPRPTGKRGAGYWGRMKFNWSFGD
jgi:TonB family protein